MSSITPRAIVTVAVLAAFAAMPQDVTLSRPDVEFAEPFSEVASVRELRDGRVIIVDTRDQVLRMVDFARGSGTLIGRTGSGPGEYRAPLSVFALPGDSSIVFDGGASRLLLILPDGRPGASLSTAHLGSSAGGIVSRFVPSRADARENLYATGVPLTVSPQGPVATDSFPITLWDRVAEDARTVAFLRARSPRDRGADVDPRRALLTSIIPFVVGDQWSVAPDGRVAIIRYDDYHVDFVLPSGTVVRGRRFPRANPRHRSAQGGVARRREVPHPRGELDVAGAATLARVPATVPHAAGSICSAIRSPDGRSSRGFAERSRMIPLNYSPLPRV